MWCRKLAARGDFADHCWGDGVGRSSTSLRGLPRLRGGRAAAFTRLDEALLSLKYDVSLGAAVSDASRVRAFLATLLDA